MSTALKIARSLARLSPTYRRRWAAETERRRQIGFARHLARKAMIAAAATEHEAERDGFIIVEDHRRAGEYVALDNPYTKTGPGYLPRQCWEVLPLFAR